MIKYIKELFMLKRRKKMIKTVAIKTAVSRPTVPAKEAPRWAGENATPSRRPTYVFNLTFKRVGKRGHEETFRTQIAATDSTHAVELVQQSGSIKKNKNWELTFLDRIEAPNKSGQ